MRGRELGPTAEATWRVLTPGDAHPREEQKELVDGFGCVTVERCRQKQPPRRTPFCRQGLHAGAPHASAGLDVRSGSRVTPPGCLPVLVRVGVRFLL